MSTVHVSETVTRVKARDEFRAEPEAIYSSDTGPLVSQYRDLCSWVDSYDEAHTNGMALLAFIPSLTAFKVAKRVVRVDDGAELAELAEARVARP